MHEVAEQREESDGEDADELYDEEADVYEDNGHNLSGQGQRKVTSDSMQRAVDGIMASPNEEDENDQYDPLAEEGGIQPEGPGGLQDEEVNQDRDVQNQAQSLYQRQFNALKWPKITKSQKVTVAAQVL